MTRFVYNKPIGGYHGVTTRLNTIQEVCDYEEKQVELNTGYPRFVAHPEVRKIEERTKQRYNALSVISFCSFRSALFSIIDYYFNKGVKFYVKNNEAQKIIHGLKGIWGDLITEPDIKEADIIIVDETKSVEKKPDQILIGIGLGQQDKFDIIVAGDSDTGFIILYIDITDDIILLRRNIGFNLSSRRAERINENRTIGNASNVINKLKQEIAKLEQTKTSNCHLYPSGMAAVFLSILSCITENRTKLVSVGNCYADTLCILEDWPDRKKTIKSKIIVDVNDSDEIESSIDESTAAVIIEIPTNPLLDVVDLGYITNIAREKGAKVIVDSTIATPYSINPLTLGADIVIHSTTKFLSGKNDHLGGSILTNDAKLLEKIDCLTNLADVYMDIEDAEVLHNNLNGFEERMGLINKSAVKVADFLNKHPLVAKVYYPGLNENKNICIERKYLRHSGGLISFVLRNSNKGTASLFYDNLKDPIIKGPSLGAEQTLICPYVLLAHYECSDDELKRLNLDRYLFRISVGIDDTSKIIASLKNTLGAIQEAGNMTKHKFETKAVGEGQDPDFREGASGDVVVPIHLTSTYARKKVDELQNGYEYCRCGNPTRTAFENCLASLEEAKHCISTSSGLAAVMNVLHLLKTGDNIIAFEDIYGGTIRIFNDILPNFGITTTFVDATNPENVKKAIKKNTKLIWLESPTNPRLRICNIKAISDIAKKDGILTAVDNTFYSPYFQKPLLLGADIVVHSTTKYIGGHSDLIGGAVILNDDILYNKLKFIHNAIGICPSPFNDFLALRGLKTLHVRMEKHQENAIKIAEFLEKHPKIKKVNYPGLKSHPQYDLNRKQASGSGAIISFEYDGNLKETINVVESTKIFKLAESLGAVESLIEHPRTMSHGSVPPEQLTAIGVSDNLIRLSVGIENVYDLIEDVGKALEKSQK